MSQSGALQNNLDEVLRRKVTNTSTSLHATHPKTAKFKPAASISAAPSNPSRKDSTNCTFIPQYSRQVRKQASTTLPSFSTPGFGRARTSGSHSRSTFPEPISISSDSTPSPGIKRSSSDSYISTESQPSSKRLKSEKENLFRLDASARTNEKGKGRSNAVPSRPKAKELDDDKPWTRMETSESNPFAMLERDYPTYCRPPAETPQPAEPSTKYPDLLSKSTEQLRDILLYNHEADRSNMEAICNYHSGHDKKEDILTMEEYKDILSRRIIAIKEMLKYREEKEKARDVQSYASAIPSAPPTRHQTPSVIVPPRLASPPMTGFSTARSYDAIQSYASVTPPDPPTRHQTPSVAVFFPDRVASRNRLFDG
ncbi:hypothetical protein C8R44DRAFT_397610 [Mycena epipterygia]|nr:hypothetical protein C8R44DRAFT_397610 [Mycena epipterygia]